MTEVNGHWKVVNGQKIWVTAHTKKGGSTTPPGPEAAAFVQAPTGGAAGYDAPSGPIEKDTVDDLVVPDFNDYASLGFHPSEVELWQKVAVNPDEAEAWRLEGFTPKGAETWMTVSDSPKVAIAYARTNVPAATAAVWHQAGYSADDTRRWAKLGFTPDDAHSWAAAGVPDAELAASLTKEGIGADSYQPATHAVPALDREFQLYDRTRQIAASVNARVKEQHAHEAFERNRDRYVALRRAVRDAGEKAVSDDDHAVVTYYRAQLDQLSQFFSQDWYGYQGALPTAAFVERYRPVAAP